MIYIKKFIDKVSYVESKQNKDLVMPVADARGLRDELAKLLAEYYESKDTKKNAPDLLEVELVGRKF
jgi:hypothetical protein